MLIPEDRTPWKRERDEWKTSPGNKSVPTFLILLYQWKNQE